MGEGGRESWRVKRRERAEVKPRRKARREMAEGEALVVSLGGGGGVGEGVVAVAVAVAVGVEGGVEGVAV